MLTDKPEVEPNRCNLARSKANRMYNPLSNKIVVSIDVVFEQSVKWCWEAIENRDFLEIEEEGDGQFFSSAMRYVGEGSNAQDSQKTGGASSGGM